MNTMLVEAYRALERLREQRPGDPQEEELADLMLILWKSLSPEEIAELEQRHR